MKCFSLCQDRTVPWKAMVVCALSLLHLSSAVSTQAQTLGQPSPNDALVAIPNHHQLALADLMPYTFTPTFIENDSLFRQYRFDLSIINFGSREARQVPVLIGMKVLATKDPVKYPVGLKIYAGYALATQPCTAYSITPLHDGRFNIPLAVTKCEIYVVVDRMMQSFDDHWEMDDPELLRGRIPESNEHNNISNPYLFHFLFTPTGTQGVQGTVLNK